VRSRGPRSSHPVLLFDGVCNLCNGTVRFLLRHDPRGEIRFASLQSDVGRRLLEHRGLEPEAFDSVVLIEDDRASLKSEAVLRMVRYLPPPWPALAVLRGLPRGLRDLVYDFIAHRRYRWFGRRETCSLPAPEARDRFLDASLETSEETGG